jgi:hypothetical protein
MKTVRMQFLYKVEWKAKFLYVLLVEQGSNETGAEMHSIISTMHCCACGQQLSCEAAAWSDSKAYHTDVIVITEIANFARIHHDCLRDSVTLPEKLGHVTGGYIVLSDDTNNIELREVRKEVV